jgi:hypothetical protein
MAAIVPFEQTDFPVEPCYTPLFHHHSLRLYNTKFFKIADKFLRKIEIWEIY